MIFAPLIIKENICKKLVGGGTNKRRRMAIRRTHLPFEIRY
jgi:hypothetical protein